MAEKKETDKLKARRDADLETSKKFMDPIHQKMDKYYEMYRNRWDNEDGFKISDLYAYVETVVPILTNNRVRSTVHSDYPDYIQHAQGMTDILDHTYDINDWDYESQEVARMAEIYRSALAYTGFDGDYKNGTGKICIKGMNIRWAYLDPAPTKFDESSFFFYVEPKRKSEVIKSHPDKKSEILASVESRDKQSGDGKNRKWWQSFITSVKSYLNFNDTMTGSQRLNVGQPLAEMSEEDKRKNSVAYIHYWYRDDNDEWRVSFWADDVFLEDRENPFWHSKLPFDIYNPTKDILSSMGIPMAEHIENLNFERNMLMNYILKNAKLHADPPLLQNTAMGNIADPRALREQYSQNGVIQINNPDMVPLNAIIENLQPPTMAGHVLDLPDRFEMMQDRTTGVNDSFRGLSEATSGKEVQLKQEAAYTRIKTKIDNFERFNKSIAEKVIVLAMQHYKDVRAFRIKGDYSKYESVMGQEDAPFQVEPIQKGTNPETQEPVYDRSEFYMYANPHEWTQQPQESVEGVEGEPTEEGVQEAFKIIQFTVEIEAGSSLPTSRLARREEAIELFTAQAIDQESLLDVYDWPKRDEIVKRMGEAARAQQEAQVQMEQMKAEQQAQQQQMQLQSQMQMKQMEMESHAQQTQMNNEAKAQRNQARQAEQLPDIASSLDKLRQAVPELAQLSDEELLAYVNQLPIGA